MKTTHTNTNTATATRTATAHATAASVTLYTARGKRIHGTARLARIARTATRGKYAHAPLARRAVERNAHGKALPRPRRLTAHGAALYVAYVSVRHAYGVQGEHAKAYKLVNDAAASGYAERIADAVRNGVRTDKNIAKALYRDGFTAYDARDVRDVRDAFAAFEHVSASGENGLHGVLCAVRAACGVYARTAHADAATRTRCVYDALASDTSGAALDIFGNAYAAVLEKRGHEHGALVTRDTFAAAARAAHAVLYASKARTARTAASVEEWKNAEMQGTARVPYEWDVYDYETLDYLRTEIAALRDACGKARAAEYVAFRLRGLTHKEIAARWNCTPRTVDNIAAAVRLAYNTAHGTAHTPHAQNGAAVRRV